MQIYVDTSALVKLIVVEAETTALRRYLETFSADTHFTAAIARTELVRAVARHGVVDVVANARSALRRLDLVALTNSVLDAAATMLPPELRTLDAIHLAAAHTAPELRAMVTYDARLGHAATDAGIAVVAPA